MRQGVFVVVDFEVTDANPVLQRVTIFSQLRLILRIFLQTAVGFVEQSLFCRLNHDDRARILRRFTGCFWILREKPAHCFQRRVKIARQVVEQTEIINILALKLARRQQCRITRRQITLLLFDLV